MSWTSIKDKLPKHEEVVYVFTEHGNQFVCLFIDGKKMTDELIMRNVLVPELDKSKPYFCSLENHGNYITTATHWMPLFKGPTDD
ncbi:MAG TPA: DUF551 domain-containing protein [Saprospiraceae bacterium]|nr:DUF551 domain-containing protein [Saprospiraceae bacterium]